MSINVLVLILIFKKHLLTRLVNYVLQFSNLTGTVITYLFTYFDYLL